MVTTGGYFEDLPVIKPVFPIPHLPWAANLRISELSVGGHLEEEFHFRGHLPPSV